MKLGRVLQAAAIFSLCLSLLGCAFAVMKVIGQKNEQKMKESEQKAQEAKQPSHDFYAANINTLEIRFLQFYIPGFGISKHEFAKGNDLYKRNLKNNILDILKSKGYSVTVGEDIALSINASQMIGYTYLTPYEIATPILDKIDTKGIDPIFLVNISL
jgi:hypothetical protein